MEDWEVKKAYQIVYEDLKETCEVHSRCIDCPIQETCGKCDEVLYNIIRQTKENLFGKDEEEC